MARNDDSKHFLHFSLIAVFLVAVLVIVAMVALVTRGPALPSGPQIVSAEPVVEPTVEENIAGQAGMRITTERRQVRVCSECKQ